MIGWVIGGSATVQDSYKNFAKPEERPSSTLNPNAKVFTPLNPNAKEFTPAKRDQDKVEEKKSERLSSAVSSSSSATTSSDAKVPTSLESQVVDESGIRVTSANVTPSVSPCATPDVCVTPEMDVEAATMFKATSDRLCTPWVSGCAAAAAAVANCSNDTDDDFFEGDLPVESDDSSDDDDDDCDELTLNGSSDFCDEMKDG